MMKRWVSALLDRTADRNWRPYWDGRALVMRRRQPGWWETRQITKEEESDYVSSLAW